ncbi:MAG: hypothetical protein K9L78_02005 [Victivallales bacterium]|nr:hypothetical protein [Victivallales bacterium]MCF7888871.1 hypothetical protein [Victivallales bacterium]
MNSVNKKKALRTNKPITAKNEPDKSNDRPADRGNKMENQAAENMKNIAEEVLRFYESSIDKVSTMVNSTNRILNEFRVERNTANSTLKDSLAKEKSVRKKDFDNILDEMIPFHDEKEEQIKTTLNDFLNEQKKAAETIKRKLSSNEKIRFDEFREMLSEIQGDRENRESEVREMLQEFQMEYKKMGEALQNFLKMDKSVRIRDVRDMMRDFKKERVKRKTEARERAVEWQETAQRLARERAERIRKKIEV